MLSEDTGPRRPRRSGPPSAGAVLAPENLCHMGHYDIDSGSMPTTKRPQTALVPARNLQHNVPATVATAHRSLGALADLYFRSQVAGQAPATIDAKRRDLRPLLRLLPEALRPRSCRGVVRIGDAGVLEAAREGAARASDHRPHLCERAPLRALDSPEGSPLSTRVPHRRHQTTAGPRAPVEGTEPRRRVAAAKRGADAPCPPRSRHQPRPVRPRGDRGAVGLRAASLRTAQPEPGAVQGAGLQERADQRRAGAGVRARARRRAAGTRRIPRRRHEEIGTGVHDTDRAAAHPPPTVPDPATRGGPG